MSKDNKVFPLMNTLADEIRSQVRFGQSLLGASPAELKLQSLYSLAFFYANGI
jgi:solute carrier family 25 (mitochondrial citrate transporter), member 1